MRASGKGLLGALVVSVALWVLAVVGGMAIMREVAGLLMPVLVLMDK